MTRERKPLTAEEKAHRAETNRAWRARKAMHLRRYNSKRRDAINAQRRKNYATQREKQRARCREWKRRNPVLVRNYNRFVLNPQRRVGLKYDGRKYKLHRAWRKFVAVCAKNRKEIEQSCASAT